MKVFLDTNVVLDTIIPGRPSQMASTELINLGYIPEIRFRISSLSIATTVYCCRKYVSKEQVMARINFINKEWQILSVGQIDINEALNSECPDYEDAIQIAAANAESDVIVTNDKKHFTPYTSLPVYTPAEFLQKLKATQIA